MSNVLIVEPHDYHYEVLPGVAHYFNLLGFNINLLVRDTCKVLDVFSRVPYFKEISIQKFESEELKGILNNKEKIQKYDFVFFNSLEYFHDGVKERLLDYLGLVPESKHGILGIYHNLSIVNDDDISFIKENRCFSLSDCDYKGYRLPVLSPVYYGTNVNNSNNKTKNEILVVGVSNDRKRIEKSIGENWKLIRRNDIHFTYIGKRNRRWEGASRIVYSMQNKSSLRGWLYMDKFDNVSFKKLYEYLDSVKYMAFVPAFGNGGEAFLNGKTSGTKQLSIGFLKPCILREDLAIAFGIPFDCCITYKTNIGEALEKIAYKSKSEYEKEVRNIKELQERMQLSSLHNLGESISSIMNSRGNT